MKKTLIRSLSSSLALILATGLSTSVLAAGADDAAIAPAIHAEGPGKHGPDGKHFGHHEQRRHGMRDGLFIPGLGPIPKAQIEALKLTVDQQKLVEDSRIAQRASHKEMRAERANRRAVLNEQLAQNKLDPRVLVKASQDAREKMRDEGQDLQKKNLAIWDSLNDVQRTQVTTFLKAREQKMAERRQHHERRSTEPAAVKPAA